MSPLGRFIGIALAIVGLLGGVWLAGDRHGHKAEQAAQARRVEAAKKVVAKTEAKQTAISATIGQQTQAKQVEIRTVTKTLIQKVPVYVTVQADAKCVVPLGFVRLHDAAAAGSLPKVPDTAGQSDDAPSGIALSAVASTVTQNYGICHENAAQLAGLQAWVHQELTATNGTP